MGGSFDAFKWAKDQDIQNAPAQKLALIMLADSTDSRCQVFDSVNDIAQKVGMAEKATRNALTGLDERGLITWVKRVRANNSDGPSMFLLNMPDAPHMSSGAAVVLDYRGGYMYPKAPEKLRERGIRWVSGGTEGAECPKKSSKTKTPGRDRVVKPTTRDDEPGSRNDYPRGGRNDQPGWSKRPPTRVVEATTLTSNPKDLQPTNASEQVGPGERGPGSLDGWPTSPKEEPARSAGAGFLSRLTFNDGTGIAKHAIPTYAEHVDMLLISGWTEDGITARITDTTGVSAVKSWPGFALRKLEDLRPLPAKSATTTPAAGFSQWCGQCDEDTRNTRDGRKCRTCHPRYAATNA